MTETLLRQKVVSIMAGWIGYSEANGKHKQIIDIYNAHKPLAVGYKVQYNDEWCATAVSAAFIRAGLTDIAPTECSCSRMIALYKALGRFMERDDYLPSPGDILMYDWQDSGAGDNVGAPDHVGIVEKVNGKTITVIEGNKGEAVSRRLLTVNGKNIRGYCLPDYAAKATTTEEEKMSPEFFYQMFLQAMARYNNERDKKAVGDVFAPSWKKAKDAGVLDGNAPRAPLTREQAAIVMDRLGLLDGTEPKKK